jgi:hypothetical protein
MGAGWEGSARKLLMRAIASNSGGPAAMTQLSSTDLVGEDVEYIFYNRLLCWLGWEEEEREWRMQFVCAFVCLCALLQRGGAANPIDEGCYIRHWWVAAVSLASAPSLKTKPSLPYSLPE